ncbi:Hpt domain-containing protein [Rhodobacter sp. Har01]|uniref:Hpt domain-containing protein n=1 Tax=Rhodobacter sp. Har01 TaxID=2883999 RepID=UPI001D06C44E|nr:Hpt domain-containing protein [Rhodobacter sp. Har01]MCB6178012.1 Hpt domain-containing protein [Rhodobacter sp. Har01]
MIDWDRLNELRDEIGEDDLAEVVVIFLDEADEVIGRLASGQSTNLESDLHFLKGSALNLGLSDLAGLCQDGEKRAAAGDNASVDLARVASLYEASKRSFLGALARGSAA